MMRLISFLALSTSLFPVAQASGPQCPVSGRMEHWRADYCMAELGTDDIVAAQPCLEREVRVSFRSSCTANLHYKRRMCKLSFKSGTVSSVDSCVKDPNFQGFAVRNGGA
jgi:hypothetical protein